MSGRSNSKLFQWFQIGFYWCLTLVVFWSVFNVVIAFVLIWRGDSALPSEASPYKRTRDIEILVRKPRTYDLLEGEAYVDYKETPWGEVTFVTTKRPPEVPPRMLKITLPPVQGGEPLTRFYVKEH